MRRVLTVLLFVFALPTFADITISTITPGSGLMTRGTIVHLRGTNLLGAPLACAALECSVYVKFGDTIANVLYDSREEIVAVAPPHSAGSVDVTVNVPLSPTLTLKNAFVYQDPADTNVRLLVPITAGTTGLLNTSWQTDVFADNETASPVNIAGTTIPPASMRRLTLSPASTGMFLQLPRGVFEGVTISTHVHDTVHDAENLGVDIPSVPETQFRQAVVLTGVPKDSRYRLLLRVYGYPGTHRIQVLVYDSTGEILWGLNPTLAGSDLSYLQLPISAASKTPFFRVEVTTLAQDTPMWAFITVTNNTTENVTTVTPSVVIAPEAPATALASGHWRGSGYCMSAGSTGDVTINDSCSIGWFNVSFIDANGHFEADGLFHQGGAYSDPSPVHFSGVVTNGTLVLTIKTGGNPIGPLTLIHDSSTAPCPGQTCP